MQEEDVKVSFSMVIQQRQSWPQRDEVNSIAIVITRNITIHFQIENENECHTTTNVEGIESWFGYFDDGLKTLLEHLVTSG